MAFVLVVALLTSVGLLLSFGTHILWLSTGRMMPAISALGLICGYLWILGMNAGLPELFCYGISTSIGLVLGILTIWVGYQLQVDEFLLLALAISELVRRIAYYADHISGGAYGLSVTESMNKGDLFFYVVGPIVVMFLGVMQVLAGRPRGLRWRIAGGSKEAAALIGLNPNKIALGAGAVLGLAAGLGGALYAEGIRYLHPDDLGMNIGLSTLAIGISARPDFLAMDITLLGLILFMLPDFLRLVSFGGANRFAVHEMILGVVLVAGALRLRKTH